MQYSCPHLRQWVETPVADESNSRLHTLQCLLSLQFTQSTATESSSNSALSCAKNKKNKHWIAFIPKPAILIEMESFFRDLFILPIICMSVDIFTVGGQSDAFGDVTVMDEEASSSVSSSLALSPWFSPENSGLLGDFGERWPISTFSVPFSETAGGWSNGLVFDIRDSPSWKISSKKQSWMSFSSYQDESKLFDFHGFT